MSCATYSFGMGPFGCLLHIQQRGLHRSRCLARPIPLEWVLLAACCTYNNEASIGPDVLRDLFLWNGSFWLPVAHTTTRPPSVPMSCATYSFGMGPFGCLLHIQQRGLHLCRCLA